MHFPQPYRIYHFAIAIALAIFLLIPSLALAQESLTVPLEPMNGSTVSGTIVLTANENATDAIIDLSGMTPGAEGSATLYANTCEQPSASFAPVAAFTADASGNVHATGRVLFRDTDVPLSDISDGGRIISIDSGEHVVACGALLALTTPALPSTGGAFDVGMFAFLGTLGLGLLLAGLALRRQARACSVMQGTAP